MVTTMKWVLLRAKHCPKKLSVSLPLNCSSLAEFIDNTWQYFEEQIDGVLPQFFPKWLQDMIANAGLDIALDLTELATMEYTDPKIFDELKGIADGSGVDYKRLVRVHMIAGLTQGKCSMFGIWGAALDPSYRNSLLQLRALDWDMNGRVCFDYY